MAPDYGPAFLALIWALAIIATAAIGWALFW